MENSTPTTSVAPAFDGYCMKDRKHVHISPAEKMVARNGRIGRRGLCPDCGKVVVRMGPYQGSDAS